MQIALIGAGPRGLLVLERLVALQRVAPQPTLSITLFDPYGIGGRVWQSDQPHELIMNTAAQQITLFYDQTVAHPAPFTPGPSLYEWARDEAGAYLAGRTDLGQANTLAAEAVTLGPNGYASRALYGAYQQWFFAKLTADLPKQSYVDLQKETVIAVRKNGQRFTVAAHHGGDFDAVVMALGNSANTLTREQETLAQFSTANNLQYWPPNWPSEPDLSAITTEDTVILRGLGLSFFDFTARLTEGRGGRFVEKDGQLAYLPSGNEPHLLAGSRRGLPYHAKARNEKGPSELVPAHFLTPAYLAKMRAQKPASSSWFWEGLQHEAEFIYYSLLLKADYPDQSVIDFQLRMLADPEKTVAALAIKEADRLDWATLMTPPKPADNAAFQRLLDAQLPADIEAAKAGSKHGPLTAALEVWRDLRDVVRTVASGGMLTDDQYLDQFLRWFNGLNDFLTIGPPVVRIAELKALRDAGIVTLLPPQMQVAGKKGRFEVTSGLFPDFRARGTVLIEARVPAANAPTAQNPLMQQLLHDDMATLYELQLAGDRRFQSGAVVNDRRTLQLLNSARDTQGLLFFWGVPTEGYHWLTTASPRPYVNDVALREAASIASVIWGQDPA
ncbi:FAD/NAD(P)-binding protein [Lacticaseibacillus mingshuiensis]|uniref:FAD/NAD(P)-binding protein n=1 Tax=Lacticaseibacillus mingshuiensis TaxID=2799574 RepID=A0ABW4CEC6_9LACO|nr:FAD/NAD(P)-binding protein [Lacticaseibacillus mingshuiensis]